MPTIEANANVPAATVDATKPETTVAVKPRGKRNASAKPTKPATNKPGKPAKRAATVEAPEADARAAAAERRAADRASVHALYATFEAHRASVPVKPVRGFKLETTTAHPIPRKPSMRQAAAVCTALHVAGVKLADKASAPRCFDVAGVPSAIENGVLRDAVSSGLIRVSGASPEAERIAVTASGVAYIRANLGDKALKAHKLI